MGELGCPSLDYVYDMTWAEFQIRAYAYNRMQEQLNYRAREVAWSALIGSHIDPKKLPKSKDRFWSIGDSVPRINERQKAAMLRAKKKFLDNGR